MFPGRASSARLRGVGRSLTEDLVEIPFDVRAVMTTTGAAGVEGFQPRVELPEATMPYDEFSSAAGYRDTVIFTKGDEFLNQPPVQAPTRHPHLQPVVGHRSTDPDLQISPRNVCSRHRTGICSGQKPRWAPRAEQFCRAVVGVEELTAPRQLSSEAGDVFLLRDDRTQLMAPADG
jgi:hypothetical protein